MVLVWELVSSSLFSSRNPFISWGLFLTPTNTQKRGNRGDNHTLRDGWKYGKTQKKEKTETSDEKYSFVRVRVFFLMKWWIFPAFELSLFQTSRVSFRSPRLRLRKKKKRKKKIIRRRRILSESFRVWFNGCGAFRRMQWAWPTMAPVS